jgi:hypothetical protein
MGTAWIYPCPSRDRSRRRGRSGGQQTAGNDTIHGSNLAGIVRAGAGNDVVLSGYGSDDLAGGITLNDILVSRPQGDSSSVRISFKFMAGSVTLLNRTWADSGVELIRFAAGGSIAPTLGWRLIRTVTERPISSSFSPPPLPLWGRLHPLKAGLGTAAPDASPPPSRRKES